MTSLASLLRNMRISSTPVLNNSSFANASVRQASPFANFPVREPMNQPMSSMAGLSSNPFAAQRPNRIVHGRLDEYQQCLEKYRAQIRSNKRRDEFFPRAADRFNSEVTRINRVGGREREEAFWRIFNKLAATAHERPMPAMHVKITKNFVSACLPKMYGTDFDNNLPDLLKRYNMDHINTRCLVSMPRRHGKTETSAAFLASLALAFPVQINVYSIGMETSKLFTAKVEWYIMKACDNNPNWGHHNLHLVEVHPLYGDTDQVSQIRSYSSNEKIGEHGVPKRRCAPTQCAGCLSEFYGF